MDEPDAYLSSQAQQDLLKIFDAFAHPESAQTKPIQVIYVTHSPFLLDRNHGERIRVLEKGVGDEGTRVVKNPSRNHYEPLRSSLGAFVAETAFIGNCNVIVEGAADQVLLAGAATFLKRLGVSDFHRLDLNRVTIVPAGSASHVPYLVYLARGRDYEKPAVIVLLDSDADGNNAKKQLVRSGPLKRLKLREELILQVHEVAKDLTIVPSQVPTAVSIEDLIPLDICVQAVRVYFAEILTDVPGDLSAITSSSVQKHMADGESVMTAIAAACVNTNSDLHVDKVGFSRAVLKVVSELHLETPEDPALKLYVRAMTALFTALTKMERSAVREATEERLVQRVDRAMKSSFRTIR